MSSFYLNFIKSELKDRLKNSNIFTLIWNLLFFPFTAGENYYYYKKWLRLLKHLNLSKENLDTELIIKVKSEKVSLLKGLENYGEEVVTTNFNSGFIILVKENVIIFPLSRPMNSDNFYTQILNPIVINFNEDKYPFGTLLNYTTFNKIIESSTSEGETNIVVEEERWGIKIKFEVKKELLLPTGHSQNTGGSANIKKGNFE